MKRLMSTSVWSFVLAGMVFLATPLFAQEAAQPKPAPPGGCPMMQGKGPMPGCCPMMNVFAPIWRKNAEGGGNMPAACAEMMKTMGMSPAMMMGCKMRMGATVSKDDPGAILALKSDLGLTDDQVKKLEELQKKTQDKAAKILTDEQMKKLAQLPDMSAMMEMCQKMMPKMREMMPQGGPASGGASPAK